MEAPKKSVTKWLKSSVVSFQFRRFKSYTHNEGQTTSSQLSCGKSIDKTILRLKQEHC